MKDYTNIISAVFSFCLCTLVSADGLRIAGFDHNGYLTFQGASISNYFTLEFAPAVDGPWTNWGAISGEPISGAVMSSPTPMFYRIRESSSDNFPLLTTGTPVYVESDPIFDLSAAATIETNDIAQWNEASSWGNHAAAGYMSATQQFSGSVTGVATNLHLTDDAFGFGVRTNLEKETVYHATEDGFAIWYGLEGSGGHSAYYRIKTGTTASPNITRAYTRPNDNMAHMITCPIRKGEYWIADEDGTYVSGSRTLYFIPLQSKH